MPRRRTAAQELRAFGLRLVVLAVFLVVMLGVVLPWASQMLADAAVQQFILPLSSPPIP